MGVYSFQNISKDQNKILLIKKHSFLRRAKIACAIFFAYMHRLIFLLLFASCTVYQNRLEEPAPQAFELSNMHFALKSLNDPSAGFSLTLSPLESLPSKPRSFPVYALKADGIPLHERFLLISFDPLKKTVAPQFEFEALEDHRLLIITADGEEISEEAPVVVKEFLKGQTIWLAAISKEHPTCTYASFVPSPFRTSIDDGIFSLSVAHRKGTHFELQGTGLLPGEVIRITEHSGAETHQQTLIADEKGKISAKVEPIVFGQLGGKATLTILRAGEESLIDYSWGSLLENESRQEAIFQPLVFVANRDPSDIDLLALQNKIDKKMFL